MGTYKISGHSNKDCTVFVIDNESKKLHIVTDILSGNYTINNLSPNDKTIVGITSSGESETYGNITPVTMSGTFTAYSSGNDGDVIIDNVNTVVNNYASVTNISGSIIYTDDNDLNNYLSVGDEIMIIQIQSDNTIIAGNWETKRVDDVSNNTVTIETPLEKTYSTSSYDKVQMVRIPNYTSLTVTSDGSITCPIWDGNKGGIIFFRATGEININGSIIALGKGFRGGSGRGGNTERYGWAGETIKPNSFETISSYNATLPGGGGGGWCGKANVSTPTGGGGGGYSTSGDDGRKGPNPSHTGSISKGGSSYGIADLTKVYFGSAGGTAHDDRGGNGGGIIIVSAFIINVSGTINVNGECPPETSYTRYNGSGAGGSLLLQANSMSIGTDLVTATGGAEIDYGGSGGDGRIRLDYSTITGSTDYPTPGYIGSY